MRDADTNLFLRASPVSHSTRLLYMRSSPFWELCLMAHVCRLYSNIMELQMSIQTHICPSRTLFFVCLSDNMLVCPFVCYPLFVCLFVCYPLFVFPLCAVFVSLSFLWFVCSFCVSFVVACTRLEQGRNFQDASQEGQECKQDDASPKREMFNSQEAQPPRVVFSFSLLAYSLEPCFRVPFLVSRIRPHSKGMTMFALYFLNLSGPYPLNVGMYALFFLYLSQAVFLGHGNA